MQQPHYDTGRQTDSYRSYLTEVRHVPDTLILYISEPLPTKEIMKDFVRYYIDTHSGAIRDPVTGEVNQRPTRSTVLKQASRLYFGFERETKTEIPKAFRAEIVKVRSRTPTVSYFYS
jgi:hypothetical protein